MPHLRTRGASAVHELAVVFDGKRVFARARGWEGKRSLDGMAAWRAVIVGCAGTSFCAIVANRNRNSKMTNKLAWGSSVNHL